MLAAFRQEKSVMGHAESVLGLQSQAACMQKFKMQQAHLNKENVCTNWPSMVGKRGRDEKTGASMLRP